MKKTGYYIVDEEILPDIFKKVVEAKILLKRGKVKTIKEAVNRAGLSRSAFYKYKDHIQPLFDTKMIKIITIALLLQHTPGILSKVLTTIAKANGNILTINQNIPIHNQANVTISIETTGLSTSINDLINELAEMEGVEKIEIIAEE